MFVGQVIADDNGPSAGEWRLCHELANDASLVRPARAKLDHHCALLDSQSVLCGQAFDKFRCRSPILRTVPEVKCDTARLGLRDETAPARKIGDRADHRVKAGGSLASAKDAAAVARLESVGPRDRQVDNRKVGRKVLEAPAADYRDPATKLARQGSQQGAQAIVDLDRIWPIGKIHQGTVEV